MRILFLTNFYPPYEMGGQGRSCLQVVEGLKQRGHTTVVLTSMNGTGNKPVQIDNLHFCLYLEMDFKPLQNSVSFFTRRMAREQHNLEYLDRQLSEFEPDLVFVWGMWNLSRQLPALAEERCPGRVVYRFAEYWPTLPNQYELYWRAPGRSWYGRLLKDALRPLALAILEREGPPPSLKLEHTICVSAATREYLIEAGVPVAGAEVIHTGLEVSQYLNGGGPDDVGRRQTLELLYLGRLSANKGVETAIEAMRQLVHANGQGSVKLTLIGTGSADYMDHLISLVAQAGLESHVLFLGLLPHEEIPQLMHHYDIMIVPSNWPEPFARVILEGMIMGLAIIATPCGGTAEIIIDGKNGLLFAPGDSQDLAQKITVLDADRRLLKRLQVAGRATVLERYTFDKMLNSYESFLQSVLANNLVAAP